ncbi:chloride channel protein C-like [Gigantopelta aegis]|uniref:chloride channel protein C-like n=1 Tax=Gigantopelta aegis TaxID=1735272 RepID=UPI001B88E4F6|nr:chloride channel protein C-like [Gigantopelta aegis]
MEDSTGPSESQELNSSGVRQRKVIRKYGQAHEPPSDDQLFYVSDDNYGMFTQGRDYEPVYITHKYTEKEKETLATFESLDYLPSHSFIYKHWIKRQVITRLQLDRWVMMGLIGFSVGLIGFLLHQLIEEIAKFKWNMLQKFLQDGESAIAWLFAVGYSIIFITFSAAVVIFWRPSAGGSGIPEVTGYLNGTHIRHIFSLQTMIVKFVSCVTAIGCGMPVGPEGPMIHLGALAGAGVSQAGSESLRFRLPIFQRFRNSEDRRNFISAGAAAGVSSAFGAPVGGLLFAMEEVSSFWTTTLSWQIFFCCMISTFTTDLFNSAFEGFTYTGQFGAFKTERYILFNINKGVDVNILMFIPTVVIGLIGGITGALFTIINLKMARTRKRLMSSISRPWIQKTIRMVEPAIIMVLVSTFVLFMPAAFPCTEYTCIEGKSGPISKNCLNDTRNPLHVEPAVMKYTCNPGTSWRVNETTYTNGTYNELASLLFGTLETSVKHLFSRDTQFQFGFPTLFTALPYFFFAVCWSSGTSISCGMLVPMLLIGALYGRIIGLVMVTAFGAHTEPGSFWGWMDPGAFALIGAASFFGGVSRLTMAVTVIMMELTNDIQVLLPVMVAVMVSKWVGDFFTHPIFHAHLELKCIPFLETEPRVTIAKKSIQLELYAAKDVMSTPVVTINRIAEVSLLADLLLSTTHGGFPVVKKDRNGEDVFYALITRLELAVLLMNEDLFQQRGQEESIEAAADSSWIEYENLVIDKLTDPVQVTTTLEKYKDEPRYKELFFNLDPYVNQSALAIQEKFSLQRTYILFRTLGLRHLTVVDSMNRVMGFITRKDLMGFSMQEKIAIVLSRQIENDGRNPTGIDVEMEPAPRI